MERNVFTPEQEKWLKALESGEWKQGRGWLKDGDYYCCLGVAVAIGVCTTSFSEAILEEPEDIEALKLRDASGGLWVTHDGVYNYLTEMNDGIGGLDPMTFGQIAAFIRANPWQVFTNFDTPADAEARR